MVDLEVPGVDNRSDGRGHRNAHGIRDGVADSEEFDAEAAKPEGRVGLDHIQPGISYEATLAQLHRY
jgi:hypothetical protein